VPPDSLQAIYTNFLGAPLGELKPFGTESEKRPLVNFCLIVISQIWGTNTNLLEKKFINLNATSSNNSNCSNES